MSGASHGGKGDTPRPCYRQAYEDNYDKIFRKENFYYSMNEKFVGSY